MKEHEYAEIFCNQQGWNRIKGFRIDHSMLDFNYPFSYWTDTKDAVRECEFWMHPDEDDAFEDIWECVDYVEKRNNLDFIIWRRENHEMIKEEKVYV